MSSAAADEEKPRSRPDSRSHVCSADARCLSCWAENTKLKGDLAGSWACSVGYDLRLIFEFVQHEGAEAILWLNIGTHDEVY